MSSRQIPSLKAQPLYRNEVDFLRQHRDKIVDYLEEKGIMQLYDERLNGDDSALLSQPDLLLYARIVFPVDAQAEHTFLSKIDIPSRQMVQSLGSSSVKMIFTNVVSQEARSPSRMTKMRDILQNRYSGASYGNSLEICEDLSNKQVERCNDRFHALIGALYIDLFYNSDLKYEALDLIEEWLSAIDPDLISW